MTVVDMPTDAGHDVEVSLEANLSPARRIADHAATAAMVLSFAVAAVPLVMIIGYVFLKGGQVVDMAFLTEAIPNSYRRVGPGMGPAVVGTVIITAAASAMAIPLGVLGAIYLNEYGKQNRLARTIRFMADVMTGVPSVVMGVFVYVVWVLRFREQTGFAGSLALACLMLPIVIRTTEEMLRLVPDELRLASLALGARRWRTTLTVVLPAALPGITSGAMLAVARAAGETAPILLVTGLTFDTNWSLFEGNNTTLAAQIFRNASQPYEGAQLRAYGAAFTLILLVFACTIVARIISARFSTTR
ncbi:MAG: phosphate ABC transporter permease PstA [Acidimicrobiales bacterium]|nr:phosphate ABC transporter permease PstA [Acidimicrobiales bacterium]